MGFKKMLGLENVINSTIAKVVALTMAAGSCGQTDYGYKTESEICKGHKYGLDVPCPSPNEFGCEQPGYMVCLDGIKPVCNVPTVYPAAEECTDHLDNDCNGITDTDCYTCIPGTEQIVSCLTSLPGECATGTQKIKCDENGILQTEEECTSLILPESLTEECNGMDEDCDGNTDEGVESLFCQDRDGDSYSVAGEVGVNCYEGCSTLEGFVLFDPEHVDCDDNLADINPGKVEIPYDGKNNDCKASTLDDDLDSDGVPLKDEQGNILDCDDLNPLAAEEQRLYQDNDGDGQGTGQGQLFCIAPGTTLEGFADNNIDPYDFDRRIYIGAAELCDDIVNDPTRTGVTDGADEPWMTDPELNQTSCGTGECVREGHYACFEGEKVDNCIPGTPSLTDLCNGLDEDCDGNTDEGVQSLFCKDRDGDSYSAAGEVGVDCYEGCSTLEGFVLFDPEYVDCDDHLTDINPGEAEIPYDGKDNDCNASTLDDDLDSDGVPLKDEQGNILDCDDLNPLAAEEQRLYQDNDRDGQGTGSGILFCIAPGTTLEGFANNSIDPYDFDRRIYIGAAELCDDIVNDPTRTRVTDGADETWMTNPELNQTSCGIGECVREGHYACFEGEKVDNCIPGTPSLTDLCNGLDEDCDPNTADGSGEAWFNAVTECGTGECRTNGRYTCENGQQEDDCTPLPPGTEVCNGRDDDCDYNLTLDLNNDGINDDGSGGTDENLDRIIPCDENSRIRTERCIEGVLDEGSCVMSEPDCSSVPPEKNLKANALYSCKTILDQGASLGSGVYWINPNGGSTDDSFKIYCDMSTAGGGWTLIMQLKASDNTFTYDSNYWSNDQTLNADQLMPSCAVAKYFSFGTISSREYMLNLQSNRNNRSSYTHPSPILPKDLFSLTDNSNLSDSTNLNLEEWTTTNPSCSSSSMNGRVATLVHPDGVYVKWGVETFSTSGRGYAATGIGIKIQTPYSCNNNVAATNDTFLWVR